MRQTANRVRAKITAGLVTMQGVIGVGCVAGGVYLIAGWGLALITFGAFLLVGAALGGGRR